MAQEQVNCRICGELAKQIFTTKVLEKHDVAYYECPNCKYIFTEQPHWLDEAYASPINVEDTGIISRNIFFRDQVGAALLSLFGKDSEYLDYAGGYGIFTRLMRDVGFDYYWTDIYTQNLVARGFEHIEGKKYAAITAFETFEHLVDPLPEVEKMLEYSDTIIFSTQMAPEPTPKAEDWWYYGLSHGQHVGIHRVTTLQYIADKFGLKLYTNGQTLHILTKAKLLPQILDARGFQELEKAASAKEVIKASYLFKQYPLGTRRPIKRLKAWAKQRLMGDYFFLLQAADHDALQQEVESQGFLTKYVNRLLTEEPSGWRRLFVKELESKTFSDMLLMKQERHTSNQTG